MVDRDCTISNITLLEEQMGALASIEKYVFIIILLQEVLSSNFMDESLLYLRMY